MTNEERVKRHIGIAIERAAVDGCYLAISDTPLQEIKEYVEFRADSLYDLLKPYLLPDTEIDLEELGRG